MGREAYNGTLQLYPNHSKAIVSMENTGDVASGIREAGQPHNVGGFQTLDHADAILGNPFEMYNVDWSSPTFPSGARNMPIFDWNAGGFNGHNDAFWEM